MKGFKDFLLRGNLIELAVAFIMASAFGTVVTTFTTFVMDVIGTVGGQPDFSALTLPGGVNVGTFITAVVSFVILAAVVYFGIVKPYETIKSRIDDPKPEEAGAPTSEELLSEIRDLLRVRQQ
jgi:large conductance mechanosensitive channel